MDAPGVLLGVGRRIFWARLASNDGVYISVFLRARFFPPPKATATAALCLCVVFFCSCRHDGARGDINR